MADAATRLMDVDAFLLWCTNQEARYELLDGVPVEMMSAASGVHDVIVTNLITSLNSQLRGGPSRSTTADIALRTRIRTVRRPDVTVTCDPPRAVVYEALEPRMAIEVLSPGNKGWDRELREYRWREALDYILLIDSEIVAATLYERTPEGWSDLDRLDEVIELPTIGCRLAMSEIYENTGLCPVLIVSVISDYCQPPPQTQ